MIRPLCFWQQFLGVHGHHKYPGQLDFHQSQTRELSRISFTSDSLTCVLAFALTSCAPLCIGDRFWRTSTTFATTHEPQSSNKKQGDSSMTVVRRRTVAKRLLYSRCVIGTAQRYFFSNSYSLGRRTVTFRIGKIQRTFTLHEDLMCRSSMEFHSLLQGNRKEREGECSICHETLDANEGEIAYCRAGCGQNFYEHFSGRRRGGVRRDILRVARCGTQSPTPPWRLLSSWKMPI